MQVLRTITVQVDGQQVAVEQLEDGTFRKPAYLAGAEREVVGTYRAAVRSGVTGGMNSSACNEHGQTFATITAPATDAAREWAGWGTALKPSHEMWWLCRKPLAEGTIAAQVRATGTGALNIATTRVGTSSAPRKDPRNGNLVNAHMEMRPWMRRRIADGLPLKGDFAGDQGRWPPNLLLSHSVWCAPDGSACTDDCPVRLLGEQSGERKSPTSNSRSGRRNGYGGGLGAQPLEPGYNDTGTAARFFPCFYYAAKASRSERNRGCEGLAAGAVHRYGAGLGEGEHPEAPVIERNTHPTVKPLSLMRWLARLVCPPGGVILDPFAGSGTTCLAAHAEGMHYLGMEREIEYVTIARARTAATAPAKPALARKPRKRSADTSLWEASA